MKPIVYYAQDLSTNGVVMLAADLVQYFPDRSHILYYHNMLWEDDKLPLYLMEKGLDIRRAAQIYEEPGYALSNLEFFPGLPHTSFHRFTKKHEKKPNLTIGFLHGDSRQAETEQIIDTLKDDKTLYFYTSSPTNNKDTNIRVCGFNPYTFYTNLKNIDILIYPVKNVYFSARTVQEALSLNIPVICPSIPLLTQNFQHSKHLLFYDSITEIAALVDLLRDHDCRNIVASGGKMVASRLSLRNQHDKIRRLLN